MPAAPSLSVHQVLPLTDAGGLAPDTAEPVTLVGGCGVGGIQASQATALLTPSSVALICFL